MITDASDPNIANTLVNYITAIVQNFNNELNSTNKPIFNISVETKMRYNPAMRSVYFFVPGLISVILMLISALMTSISITREKELGNMELLLVSPVKSLQVIVAKVLPYTLLAMINAITVLLAGFYVFGVPVLGNVFFLLSECLLYIITSLSLGIFISTKSDTQQAAFMVSLVGLMLPTIVLSGYIFPIENMPLVLQWISNLIPAKWFLIIIRDIMLKGSDITYVWKETLVLAGFAVFFILLSVKNYKERLQ
jgi:ABC-2 type transport system permease protein